LNNGFGKDLIERGGCDQRKLPCDKNARSIFGLLQAVSEGIAYREVGYKVGHTQSTSWGKLLPGSYFKKALFLRMGLFLS